MRFGVPDDSRKRLSQATRFETDLIAAMREEAPDAEDAVSTPLNLQPASQKLRDQGQGHVRPDVVGKLLRGMARDGRALGGGKPSCRQGDFVPHRRGLKQSKSPEK